MKKFTLIFITSLFIIATANAQIGKGSIFLGGDLGASNEKTKRNGVETMKQNSLNISPVFGKAIKENLIFGANVTIGLTGSNSSSSGSASDQHNNIYGAGIFLRKYKSLGKSGFSLFLQGNTGFNYNRFKVEQSGFIDERKRYTVGVSAYPGISYSVSKRLQLETGFNNLVSLNYFNEKRIVASSTSYTEKTNGIGINTSLDNLSSLYLGFRVLLNKR